MTQHTLSIEGIGPIRNPLDIHFPAGGGIVVLQGLNEAGKSTALNSARALLGAGNPLQHSDGIDRGTVVFDGGAARITVAKTTRKTGEVGVARLEGVDPMALVEPGIKDPLRADDERIRILSTLARVKLEPGQFAALVGGEEALRDVANHKSFSAETAPEMAAAFKRDFESAARRFEEQAREQEVLVEGIRVTTKDVDVDAEHDEKVLARATELAMRALSLKEGEANEARTRSGRVAEARRKLDEWARSRGGISSTEAQERIDACKREIERCDEVAGGTMARVTALRTELAKAEADDRVAVQALRAAREAEKAAKELHAQAIEAERAIDEAKVLAASDAGSAGPSEQELADLRRSLDAARKRQDNGVLVRDALAKLAQANAAAEKASALRARADKMREAALGCEELLTLEIQKKAPRGLRVRNGRLVMPTARSSEEIFAERSFGARTRVAVDIAIDAIGEGGILVLPQEAFEGLDPVNRAELHAHLCERNTWMLTAACDGGRLRAETFKPGSNGEAA